MATLTQRTEAVEERTDSLETILARFMTRTDAAIDRLESIVERREHEGTRDREAAARDRREMNKRWGELANKMGTVVEDIVAPSIRRLAREMFDCGELRQFWTRMSASRSDDARRFAAFLESGELACYFPQYRKLPIVAAFSSLSIPDDLVTYLTRRGIYAPAPSEQT